MNQKNVNDKVKDIFGSLDREDLAAAQERKERIWSKVKSDEPKKKDKPWLLVLLFGGLLFAAGWFLKPNTSINSAPITHAKIPSSQNNDDKLQFALNEAKLSVSALQESMDSLQSLNASLTDRLLLKSENVNIGKAAKNVSAPQFIRDTVYITEIKIEERIMEKIIRDTIILEVLGIQPIQEPMVAANEKLDGELLEEKPSIKKSVRPSSMQFNFSETNDKDK